MTSIFYSNKADNNIAFVCKSHYVDCLINELGIDNSLGNPTYTLTTRTTEEIVNNHMSVFTSLEFQSKMKNLIYCHSTGFLNYTSLLTNSVVLMGLPHAQRQPFPNYYRCLYWNILSSVHLYYNNGVCIMCIL